MDTYAQDAYPHQPVLYNEILKYLQPVSNGKYVDGTVGAGGHAEGILSISAPSGFLLGLDIDNHALNIARKRLQGFSERCSIIKGSYADVNLHLQKLDWKCVDGMLLDLGLSSMQLDTAKRGFSFSSSAPLDMRFDSSSGRTAADLLNTLSEKEIANIIWSYGDEPRSRQIAKQIIKQRPISTTDQLATLVLGVYHGKRGKTHPGTRTFQALRIAVNDELDVLKRGLEKSLEVTCSGGRIAVITFHSIEDRIVKQFFQQESKDCICPAEQPVCTCDHRALLEIITKKAVKPSQEELIKNPRARSAKLRVAQKK